MEKFLSKYQIIERKCIPLVLSFHPFLYIMHVVQCARFTPHLKKFRAAKAWDIATIRAARDALLS